MRKLGCRNSEEHIDCVKTGCIRSIGTKEIISLAVLRGQDQRMIWRQPEEFLKMEALEIVLAPLNTGGNKGALPGTLDTTKCPAGAPGQ